MNAQTAAGNVLRTVTAEFTTLETPDGSPIGYVNEAGPSCFNAMPSYSHRTLSGNNAEVRRFSSKSEAVDWLEAA